MNSSKYTFTYTIIKYRNVVYPELERNAWGRARDPQKLYYTTLNPFGSGSDIRRGYTMHEHLEEFNLINMNGRVYDPLLARFLNADPLLQDITDAQNYNRYSYVLNNPTKYTDPSGYAFSGSGGGDKTKIAASFSNSLTTSTSLGMNEGGGMDDILRELFYGNSPLMIGGFKSGRGSRFSSLKLKEFKVGSNPKSGVKSIKSIATIQESNGDYSPYYQNQGKYTGTEQESEGGAATVLSGGWAAAIAEPTPIGEIIMGTATGIAWLYYGPTIIEKMDREIEGIKERVAGPPGYQYALVANTSGFYPIMTLGKSLPTGSIYLNAGDVWKYGETTSTSRYQETYLRSIGVGGVTEVPQFYGSQMQIKIQEKIMIYNYYISNGKLPPGNKIFR